MPFFVLLFADRRDPFFGFAGGLGFSNWFCLRGTRLSFLLQAAAKSCPKKVFF